MYKKILAVLIILICCQYLKAQTNVNENLAFQYYQQGAYEKAIPLLEKLFSKSKNESYFELYYQSLINIKQYDEAEKLCRKLIKQNPNRYIYSLALGKTFMQSGKTKEAEKIFNETIKQFADTELQTRELANAFYRLENYDKAIQTFLYGRKVIKDEQVFGFELLSLYRLRKDKQALINEYLNMLPSHPTWLVQAKTVLGNLLETYGDYQLLQSALIKIIQKNPQNETFNDLLTWQYLQKQEYELALRQLIAKDKRTKNADFDLFNTANSFVYNKAYETAIKAYEYLAAKGESEWYIPSKIRLINTKYELAIQGKTSTIELKNLANEFSKLIQQHGINQQTILALRKLAQLQAYYLQQPDSAESILEKAIDIPLLANNEKANLKIDLGDIYILNNQNWEAFLVYEQVAREFENTEVGQDAQFRSTRLSFFQGNFNYAKSQADVLRNATSQLIANDAIRLSLLISDNLQNGKADTLALKQYADAQLLIFKNKNELALKKLDSIALNFPNNSLADEILLSKSKLLIKETNYLSAVEQLRKIIRSYPQSIWIDEAIFNLAELLEQRLQKSEEAKQYYQQLITDYPGSMYLNEARKRYRHLRGDNLGV